MRHEIVEPMPVLKLFLLLATAVVLSACTTIQRAGHMYGNEAPPPLSFHYKDGGSSIYYTFIVGDTSKVDTAVFFYGVTGCPSWKSVMPEYVSGLKTNTHIYVLNKRFVADRSIGLLDCGQEFHRANNPSQWVADYAEFINAQLRASPTRFKKVVLVGVSEGAWPATKVAGLIPAITHLAIIGSGGESMRRSLVTLKEKGAILFDVESGWKEIATDPQSIEKQWYGNTYRWWSDVMDMDPLPDFLKLNIPIILGIGEKDESVPVESVLLLESAFKKAGKGNLIVHIYPDADHRLNSNSMSYRNQFFSELGHLLQQTQDIDFGRDVLPQSGLHSSP